MKSINYFGKKDEVEPFLSNVHVSFEGLDDENLSWLIARMAPYIYMARHIHIEPYTPIVEDQ